MIAPTINLNGDDKQTLLDPVIAAMIAVSDATRAVQSIAPNGRNYPAGDVQEALSELLEIVAQMEDIQRELIAYMEAIEDQ
jgi:hypothetical protein